MNEGEDLSTPIDSGEANFDTSRSEPENGRESAQSTSSEPPRRRFTSSRRYRGPSDEQQYAAATNLANNPNTPEFFSDAVMANTQAPKPRKSHKGLIIALLAIVILAASGVTAWLLLAPSSPVAKKEESKDVRTLFNEFANYLLYGRENDSSDITAEYEPYNFYYHSDPNNKDTKEYLKKSEEKYGYLFDAYVEQYPESHLIDSLENYYDSIDLISYFEAVDFMDGRSLLKEYAKSPSTVRQSLRSYYSEATSSPRENTSIFIKDYLAAIDGVIDNIGVLDSFECFDSSLGLFYDRCASETNSEINAATKKYSSSSATLSSFYGKYREAFFGVYGGIWYLKNNLYNNVEGSSDEK